MYSSIHPFWAGVQAHFARIRVSKEKIINIVGLSKYQTTKKEIQKLQDGKPEFRRIYVLS